MGQMQILGLVALFAGIAKTAILLFPKTENKLTSAFALVCISMILQNAFEFLVAVTYYTNPSSAAQVFRAEVLSLILLAYCLLIFSLTTIENQYIKPISLVFGIFVLACTYLLLTGRLVQGYEQVAYSLISVPAELYGALTIYGLVIMTFIPSLVAYSSLSTTGELRTRSQQVLVAILPICLIALAVVVLRLVGFHSSTAVFMPIATTFFVAMMVLQQSGQIVIFRIKWAVIWKLAISMKGVKLGEWVGLGWLRNCLLRKRCVRVITIRLRRQS